MFAVKRAHQVLLLCCYDIFVYMSICIATVVDCILDIGYNKKNKKKRLWIELGTLVDVATVNIFISCEFLSELLCNGTRTLHRKMTI